MTRGRHVLIPDKPGWTSRSTAWLPSPASSRSRRCPARAPASRAACRCADRTQVRVRPCVPAPETWWRAPLSGWPPDGDPGRGPTGRLMTPNAATLRSAPRLTVVPAARPHAALGEGLVARARLVRRLTEVRDVALTLLVAPAGYGKTTTLVEWAQHDERP